MQIGVLINARMGSTRLPGKHMQLISGKPALQHLCERLQEFEPIIATGYAEDNLALRIPHFRTMQGSDSNIPLRHLQIAAQMHETEEFDAIISVDGDDLFTSPTAIKAVIAALRSGKQLVRTEGLPYGFNVLWAYTTKFLAASLDKPHPEQLDTFWGEIFPKDKLHVIQYHFPENSIRATLDYPTDLLWFRMVLANCPREILADDLQLTGWLKENAL